MSFKNKRKRVKNVTRVASSNLVKNYKLSKSNNISYLTAIGMISHEIVSVVVN